MNSRCIYLVTLISLFILSGCEGASAVPNYDGTALYLNNCSNCHGVYGEGNGAVTPSLTVVMQDLRYLADRNSGTFPTEFVRKIVDGRETRAAHGPEEMPMWGNVFTTQEGVDRAAQIRVDAKIGSLVEFLDSIQIHNN
ncbi:MAG: mono/diheme cytochrome c family protein [Limisphaerales bacterium]|jgi:mono/diheme cytochrome c family protein